MATATKDPTPKAPKPSKAEAWVDATAPNACVREGMPCDNQHSGMPGVIVEVLNDACRVFNKDGTLTTANHEQLSVPQVSSFSSKMTGGPADDDAALGGRLSDLFVVGLSAMVDVSEFAGVEGHPEQLAAAIKRDLAELKAIREAKAKAEEGEDTVPLDPLKFLTLCRQIEKMLDDAHFTVMEDGKEEDRLDVAVDGVAVRPWYFMGNPWRCVSEFASDLRGEAEDMLGFAQSQLVKQKLEGKKISPAPTETVEGGGDSFYLARRKINEAVVEARIAYDLWQESKPERDGTNEMEQVETAFNMADSALTNLSDNFVEDSIYAARLKGGDE